VGALSDGVVQVVERFKGEPTFGQLTMTDVVRAKSRLGAGARLL
jgi:predicted ribonuclease YlaK